MKFKLFKEKEVFDTDNTHKTNDIVDDFDSFSDEKNNTTRAIINDDRIYASIYSFKSNFTEEISGESSSYSYNNTSKSQDNSFESNHEIPNNINYEPSVDYDAKNIQSFNPYLNNDIGTYIDVRKAENDKPITNFNQSNSYHSAISKLNEITNNIENSQDVNVALSNIYNNKNNNDIVTIDYPKQEAEVNKQESYIEPKPSVPIYSNPYQNSDTDPGYQRCPKCGQKIREDYKQCFVCGTII